MKYSEKPVAVALDNYTCAIISGVRRSYDKPDVIIVEAGREDYDESGNIVIPPKSVTILHCGLKKLAEAHPNLRWVEDEE